MSNTADTEGPGRRPIAGILLALFGAFLAVGCVLPVLPRYVRGPLDSGDVAVAVVVTAAGISAIVARPVGGRLADARGRRVLFVAGAAFELAAGLAYLVADSVPTMIGARLLLGIGEGLVFTAAAAWIVSQAPADRRGQLVGFAGLSMWSGLTLGPLAGAALLELSGYDAVWIFAAVTPVVAAVVGLRLPDPAPRHPQRSQLLPRAAVRPGVALALASVGYAALAAFVVLHLDRRGVGHGALVFTAFGSTYVLTRLLLGRLPDRLGPHRVALWSGIGEAAGLCVVAAADSLPIALAGAVLTGAGFSLLYPSLALMVIMRGDPTRQGAALGAYTSFWDVGLSAAGPLVGLIADEAGYQAAFLAAAVCAAGAAMVAAAGSAARRARAEAVAARH
ncbi:MAG TPA: MFS transporter [Solirubrobacteraceae bacterium]|jgi:MFS family permease|nr:MFS transporter [Solirubrobacteraceae bacterium]